MRKKAINIGMDWPYRAGLKCDQSFITLMNQIIDSINEMADSLRNLTVMESEDNRTLLMQKSHSYIGPIRFPDVSGVQNYSINYKVPTPKARLSKIVTMFTENTAGGTVTLSSNISGDVVLSAEPKVIDIGNVLMNNGNVIDLKLNLQGTQVGDLKGVFFLAY